MTKEAVVRIGDIVDLYDEGDLVCAVVAAEEKGRLRVVTESGKHLSVTASRVAHRVGSVPPASDPAQTALRHAHTASSLISQVDLPALWDVLAGEARRYALGEMASLALGEDAAAARSAILRVLHADRTYFTRKLDQFEPRSRELVEETLKREAIERARAVRRAVFLKLAREALKGAAPPMAGSVDTGATSPGQEHADLVADLVELALMGDEAGSRKEAVDLLDDAGAPDGPSAERAFHLLRALGFFHEDENLFIHRFRLRTVFPPEVERHARLACATDDPPKLSTTEEAARRDLRGLTAFTIDDEETTEMDDAISIDPLPRGKGAISLGIHIADPGRYVRAGDPVDSEAVARAATFYFPETKIPMLPAVIAEQAASLVPGEDRPALSFVVRLSPIGEVIESEIVSSVIRSRARLTYEEADALLAVGGPATEDRFAAGERSELTGKLERLRSVCEALEAERAAAGAVIIRAAEVSIKVEPGGAIRIRRIDERGPSRRMVAEAMILANRLAADFCVKRGIPAIFRKQGAPQDPPARSGGSAGQSAASADASLLTLEAGGYDPVAIRALRRRMRRGEVSLQPGPHHGLGLQAYTQATSPIRRYQDLVVHRQIKAALLGEPLPYDTEALARIAASTEEAEKAAREAERGTAEYWILKHYQTLAGSEVQGVVVAAEARRTEVELTDSLYNVTIAPRPGHRPGMLLRLMVEAARPRARRLTLREIEG